MVLAVNAWDEPYGTVKRFAKKHKLKHPMLLNGGEVARSYGVPGLPAVLWIDRQGRVSDVDTRFHNATDLKQKARKLLNAK